MHWRSKNAMQREISYISPYSYSGSSQSDVRPFITFRLYQMWLCPISIRILSTGYSGLNEYGKNLDFILLIFIYKIFRLYWIACTRMAFLSFITYHITMQKNQHYDDEKSFSFMSLLSFASLSLVNAK